MSPQAPPRSRAPDPGPVERPPGAPGFRALRTRAGGLLPPPGPERPLAAAAFAGAVSQGLFLACGVLFAVRWVGVSGAETGLAMSFGTAVTLLLPVPVGRLVDRVGARRSAIGFCAAAALALIGYGLVASLGPLVAALVAMSGSFVGLGIAQNALVAGVLVDGDRTRFKAYQRSVRNIGIALGTSLAAVPVHLDAEAAYRAAILTGAAAMLVAAWFTARTPAPPPVARRSPGGALGALRDLPYMAVSLLCGIMACRYSILTVALPLWITQHTGAPQYLVSLVLLTNTVLVVLLQVRVARSATTVTSASRSNTLGGIALAGSCAIFAASGTDSAALAVTLVLLGVVVFTAGEMLTSAAGWTFAFDLTRGGRHGDYQAGFALGGSLGALPGPALAALLVSAGALGWGLGAALFVLAAAATAAAVTRTRGRHGEERDGAHRDPG